MRARARGWSRRPGGGSAMRIAAPLALPELLRAPGRTLLRLLTPAAAVGLLAAMLLFVGHSLRPITARGAVGGARVVPAPPQLLQPRTPLVGPAPPQPPAIVAFLQLATFAAKVAPALPLISSATGASAVPGSQEGTQWQVQAQLAPSA